MSFEIIECTLATQGTQILGILNEAILNSTAIWDEKPRTEVAMVDWFGAKTTGNYPVVGVNDSHGELAAFGTYGQFRAWPGYRLTVEHSVYVRPDQQGHGLGKQIMRELISRATGQGMHAMIGGIDASNSASIALHEKLGFKHVGTLPEVGRKFDRWLDLAFYELILN